MPFEIGINNAIVISAHNRYTPKFRCVGIDNGYISLITEKKLTSTDARTLLDASGKILMPGLVNGHCHGDMTLARGLGDDLTLMEQNLAFEDTHWFHSLITDDDRYYSRLLTYAEALLSGTTFLMENMYWDLGDRSAEAMARSGLRGALAEDIRRDFANSDTYLSEEQLLHFGKICKLHDLLPVIATPAEEDFTRERVLNIQQIVQKLGYLQTCHLAETHWRMDIVRDRFETTPVQFLHDCGALHSGMIGSHCVYSSEFDIRLMREYGVKVVNTPLCEMKIGDGIAPVPQYLRAGIPVGLGTDGAMWNNSNDIFREMKGMALLHTVNSGVRTLKTADILDMATINGAAVFGLDDKMGTIEAGKWADLILIDAMAPHMMPLRTGSRENVTSGIVFSAVGADVTDVIIRGRQVVENRRLLTMDLSLIYERVSEASERIANHYK